MVTRIEVWVYGFDGKVRMVSTFSDWRNALACLAYEHQAYRWSIHTAIRPTATVLILKP